MFQALHEKKIGSFLLACLTWCRALRPVTTKDRKTLKVLTMRAAFNLIS